MSECTHEFQPVRTSSNCNYKVLDRIPSIPLRKNTALVSTSHSPHHHHRVGGIVAAETTTRCGSWWGNVWGEYDDVLLLLFHLTLVTRDQFYHVFSRGDSQWGSQELCSRGTSHWRRQSSIFSDSAQRSFRCHSLISGLLQQDMTSNTGRHRTVEIDTKHLLKITANLFRWEALGLILAALMLGSATFC